MSSNRAGRKPTAKAQYRGSAAARDSQGKPASGVTRRSHPGSQISVQAVTRRNTALSTISEAVPQRDTFVFPDDDDGLVRSSVQKLEDYLFNKEISKIFKGLCKQLLSGIRLPCNPYPGFAKRMRIEAEKFTMLRITAEEILEQSVHAVQKTRTPWIYKSAQYNHVWGLQCLVQSVCASVFEPFVPLVLKLKPRGHHLNRNKDYSIKVYSSIVGPAVFWGSFYPEVSSLDIRMDYIISGPDIGQGCKLFLECIMEDVDQLESSTHRLLGVSVPVQADDIGDKWVPKMWTVPSIRANSMDFMKDVGEAVIANKLICSHCLFSADGSTKHYIKGDKQYALTCIKLGGTDGETIEEDLQVFSGYPYVTLYEGFFVTQMDAEGYLNTFAPWKLLQDKRANVTGPSKGQGDDEVFGGMTELEQFSRKNKVATDGFKAGEGTGLGPEAWQVTAPIKGDLQRQCASAHMFSDLNEIVYNIIRLFIMDMSAYNEKIRTDIYQFLRGNSAQIYIIEEINKTLRRIIISNNKNLQSADVSKTLTQLKEKLADLTMNPLAIKSSDLRCLGKILMKDFEDIEVQIVESPPPHDTMLTPQVLLQLKNVHTYLKIAIMQYSENALYTCTVLEETIQTLRKAFPEEVERPFTPERDRGRKGRTQAKPNEALTLHKHGHEDPVHHKHDVQVLDVQTCIERDTAPKTIATESVLLRYVLDTHLDETWSSFIMDLLVHEDLPINPYPLLVTQLRENSIRMDVFHERLDERLKRIFPNDVVLVDSTHEVYSILSVEAFGYESALLVLDLGAWIAIKGAIEQLVNTRFPRKKGPLQLAVCTAVNGNALLYGRICPYLVEITIHEHCYIQGPDKADDAIYLYANIVCDHLVYLAENNLCLVLGAYTNQNKFWSMQMIQDNKEGYIQDLVKSFTRKRNAYYKLFVAMEDRYVLVHFYHRLHFFDYDETMFVTCFDDHPADYYCNVFFSKEKAAFHHHYSNFLKFYGGPADDSHVAVVLQAMKEDVLKADSNYDWLSVHGNMLWWDIIQNTKKPTLLTYEAWSSFHSIAYQLQYLISVGRDLRALLPLIKYEPVVTKEQTNKKAASNDVVVDKVTAVVTHMLTGWRQKIEQTLESPRLIGPKAFLRHIVLRLRTITEKDPITKELFFTNNNECAAVINEVCISLKVFKDALAYDTHNVCDANKDLVQDLQQTKMIDKPTSATSVQLSNPARFMTVPRAVVGDNVE